MRDLIRYILRYHFVLLFILLEFFCFTIIVRHNAFQKSRVINFGHSLSGYINSRINNISDYFHLRKVNRDLVAENNYMYNELARLKSLNLSVSPEMDSIRGGQYKFIPARVVNNSTNKRFNYITLNKGIKDSIETEMAVVTNYGVVGVINRVSKNYSTAISILNPGLKISVKIKRNGYFGPLSWEGERIDECVLNEIPQHVDLEKGDTIVTSGYSAIFPEGILIGFIDDYKLKDGNFFEIKVKLALQMKSLNHVNIVNNRLKEEQIRLESENITSQP